MIKKIRAFTPFKTKQIKKPKLRKGINALKSFFRIILIPAVNGWATNVNGWAMDVNDRIMDFRGSVALRL